MAALSISNAWEETKSRIAVDGKLMITVAAATVLLPQAIVTLMSPPEMLSGQSPPGWLNLAVFAAAIMGLVGQLAIIRLALGPATSVGEAVSHGARRFLPALAALLLLAIAIGLLAIPLVILFAGFGGLEAAAAGAPSPMVGIAALIIVVLGVLLGARFMMVMPVSAAEAGGPIHILRRSWSLASGHYFKLVAFVILILIAVLAISLAVQLGGGSVIALIFDVSPFSAGALLYGLLFGAAQAAYAVAFSVMLARIYLQLSGGEPASVSVPKSGT